MSRAKELLEQATPLPWKVYDAPRPGIDSDGRNVVYASTFTSEFGGVGRPEDAALIVYAANRLPDYEAAVEALERLINVGDALWEDHPPVWMSEADEAREALRRLRDEVPDESAVSA